MKKKIWVGVIAVGIAVMLVALPYEANAIAPLVGFLIGTTVGAAVFGVLAGYLWGKNSVDHVEYSTNWTAYRKGWQAQWETWDNEIKSVSSYATNTVNLLNNTDLYYVRYAERKGLEYLNVSNFTQVEDKVIDLLNKDFKATYQYILYSYLPILRDIYLEVNGIKSLSTNYVEYEAWKGTSIEPMAKSQNKYGIPKWFIWIGAYSDLTYTNLQNDFNNVSRNVTCVNETKVVYHGDWQNDSLDTILSKQIWIVYYSNWSTQYYCVNANYFYDDKDNGGVTVYKRSSGSSAQDTYNGFAVFTSPDSTRVSWHPTKWNLNAIRNTLKSSYDRIRNNAITESRTLWQAYKDAGYNNISQLPESDIPIFPDITLDNLDALGNLSLPDAYALYWRLLQQLPYAVLQNKSILTGYNLTIADYSGKIATITLIKANATTVLATLINNHKCYILPTTEGITISVNGTYAIYDNTSLGGIESVITSHFGVTNINNVFTQQFMIYDIDANQWFILYPNHDYAYAFHVAELTKDNQSVNTLDYPISNFNDFVYPRYGFRFNPWSPNPPTPIPPPSGGDGMGDILQWIKNHKGWLTIGFIILGVLFMAGSKKGSGGYTLGAILLLAGLGMLAYYYILPAWHGFTSTLHKLNPLNWFK